MSEICKYCGREIKLAPFGKHYKWVGEVSGDWHCGSDPAFPVRGHEPVSGEVTKRDQSRKALVEMMVANMHGGDHHVDLTLNDAVILAERLAPLVERIIDARVRAACKDVREEMEGGYAG